MIWWEKYRPKTIDNFVGQRTIVQEVCRIIEGDAPMQHFLFYSQVKLHWRLFLRIVWATLYTPSMLHLKEREVLSLSKMI